MADERNAIGFCRPAGVDRTPAENAGGSTEDFRLSILDEARASLDRCLLIHRPETIGRAVGRKPATIYEWHEKKPFNITLFGAEQFVALDTDVDYALRMSARWMEVARRRALIRAAHDQIAIAVQTVYPVHADAESIRRATGRPDLGDD